MAIDDECRYAVNRHLSMVYQGMSLEDMRLVMDSLARDCYEAGWECAKAEDESSS